MDLRNLRVFVAIAEGGSLAAAGKVLRLSSPSLSSRLKDLEDEVAAQLFERRARGLVLTEQGREFLSHAHAILKLAEDAKSNMLNRDRPPVGAVRFGVPSSLIGIVSVPLLEACQQKLPQVKLKIVESMSGYLARWLREGALEAAFVFGGGTALDKAMALLPVVEEDLYLATYAPADLAPYLTPRGEVRLQDLRHLRLVLPGPEHGLRMLVDATARRHGVLLNVGIEIDASSQLFEIVKRGHGVTVCSLAARHGSAITASAASAPLHVFRLVEPGIRRQVHLATPLNRPQSRATLAVAKAATELLRALAATEDWRARVAA